MIVTISESINLLITSYYTNSHDERSRIYDQLVRKDTEKQSEYRG